MKNEQLAQWLQDHADMLGRSEKVEDNTLYETLYEGIIDIALNGETRMVDSVLENAAAHAVGANRSLTNLLGVPQRLRERIWQRIGDEIDPEPGFVMLTAVDAIFVYIIRVMIDAYLAAYQLANVEKAVEVSQLYSNSEKKLMDYAAEVARANRELERLEQAKTDFISIAAHELKTPLTLIQGYINMLREMEVNEKSVSFIDGIYRGAQRMGTIIDNMLDLSALDTSRMNLVLEPINLKSMIALIITQFDRALTERHQTVELVELEALPRVEADPARLHQIFQEIISNAIKYTPDGGKITINGQSQAATELLPDSVRIQVKDTGIGIAPEDRANIFQRFYRSSSSNLHSTGQTKFMGAGPGLGLAIVKGLVEAHGGQVWAESPGFDIQNYPGSTFNVVLLLQVVPPAGINVKRILSRD